MDGNMNLYRINRRWLDGWNVVLDLVKQTL